MGYSKRTFQTVYSENSDYSSPNLDTGVVTFETTPEHYFRHVVSVPHGGIEGHSLRSNEGYKLDLSSGNLNSTPTSVMIRNLDPANNLLCDWNASRLTLDPDLHLRFDFRTTATDPSTHLWTLENTGYGQAYLDEPEKWDSSWGNWTDISFAAYSGAYDHTYTMSFEIQSVPTTYYITEDFTGDFGDTSHAEYGCKFSLHVDEGGGASPGFGEGLIEYDVNSNDYFTTLTWDNGNIFTADTQLSRTNAAADFFDGVRAGDAVLLSADFEGLNEQQHVIGTAVSHMGSGGEQLKHTISLALSTVHAEQFVAGQEDHDKTGQGVADRVHVFTRNHQKIGPGEFLHIPGHIFESLTGFANTSGGYDASAGFMRELHEIHLYGETEAVKTEIVWLE